MIHDLKTTEFGAFPFIIMDSTERHGFDFRDVFNMTPFFNEISKKLHVDMDVLYCIVDSLGIAQREIYDYSTTPNSRFSLKVAENALYEEVWDATRSCKVRKTYDVYICEHQYICTLLGKIVERVMHTKFPQFFTDPLIMEQKPRYDFEINLKPTDKVMNLSSKYNDLSLGEIAIILSNKEYATELVMKSKCKFYDCDVFYIRLDEIELHGHKYEYNLAIPMTAFFELDWLDIENKDVYSIIKPNANSLLGKDSSNWFYGKQKDAPYFNLPMVDDIRELFYRSVVRG